MSPEWSTNVANIVAVTRREFVTRTGNRGFIISTLILVIAAVAIGLAPVVIRFIDRNTTQTVAVYAGAADLHGDPVATLDALLNAASGTPPPDGSGADGGKKDFTVELTANPAGARQGVLDGKLNALVDIERDPTGEPVFTIYAKDPGTSRTVTLIRQAVASIAIADRLGNAGLSVAEQSHLFSAPTVRALSPDPAKQGPDGQPSRATTATDEISNFAVTFGLVMFLFLAVIIYGTWIAMSVVEEKTNRVMEIILSTASPFQLLAGKVLGVGGAALAQYLAVLAAALVAILLQGQVAAFVLGDAGGLSLPTGLTPGILLVFSVYFVLGFMLYAVLFAAAGSLVSRQEDVSQVVTPMTLVSTAGYLIGLYASIGIVDANASWVVALSWVPFLSPYMMLGRMSAGEAGPVEVVGTMALMVVTIVVAVWLAARIYSAGVLMYGQRPGARRMWKALREAR
jgi:ABC-2 type transport system permease protein